MTYRKRSLRKMPPVTRRYARLLGELESVLRKGKNLTEEISRLEFEAQALAHAKGGDFPKECEGDCENCPSSVKADCPTMPVEFGVGSEFSGGEPIELT